MSLGFLSFYAGVHNKEDLTGPSTRIGPRDLKQRIGIIGEVTVT